MLFVTVFVALGAGRYPFRTIGAPKNVGHVHMTAPRFVKGSAREHLRFDPTETRDVLV
jgi:hypothetical protein